VVRDPSSVWFPGTPSARSPPAEPKPCPRTPSARSLTREPQPCPRKLSARSPPAEPKPCPRKPSARSLTREPKPCPRKPSARSRSLCGIFSRLSTPPGAKILARRDDHANATAPRPFSPPRTAAPHRTAPHRTAQHRTAQHRAAPHSTAPHSTAPRGRASRRPSLGERLNALASLARTGALTRARAVGGTLPRACARSFAQTPSGTTRVCRAIAPRAR